MEVFGDHQNQSLKLTFAGILKANWQEIEAATMRFTVIGPVGIIWIQLLKILHYREASLL